jgi:A/G-specific adenine glycosylase
VGAPPLDTRLDSRSEPGHLGCVTPGQPLILRTARHYCSTLSDVWTRGLAGWYRAHGRHKLPWRQTSDPWAVLVSEVMLQQTQVSRVLPYWETFMERWPAPADFAAAPLDDVLRAWQGLGYPRRARSLWLTAAVVARDGWPRTGSELRQLPGVGEYTARALIVLAFGGADPIPHDVNIARVAARAAVGVERDQASKSELDRAIKAGRPPRMTPRDYTYALFDAGALHCRATPRCEGCPLATSCKSRWRVSAGSAGARRQRSQSRYAGSMRELRGSILAAFLSGDPPTTITALRRRVAPAAASRRTGAVEGALASLEADRLVESGRLTSGGSTG